MHQYVDKPRLHANYSLTELIFVIVTKLRNFVKRERGWAFLIWLKLCSHLLQALIHFFGKRNRNAQPLRLFHNIPAECLKFCLFSTDAIISLK